jgi:GNAT superfamily N-acetyltransferase
VGIAPLAFGGWSRRDRDPGAARDAGGGARALDPATEPARIVSLAVRSDFSGRGLAAGIVDECAATARLEGFTRIAVMSTPEAEAMFVRCGFDVVRRPTLELDSQPVPAVEMELRLR